MDKNLDDHLPIIQSLVDTKNKDNEGIKKTLKKHDSEFIKTKTILAPLVVQNKYSYPDKAE